MHITGLEGAGALAVVALINEAAPDIAHGQGHIGRPGQRILHPEIGTVRGHTGNGGGILDDANILRKGGHRQKQAADQEKRKHANQAAHDSDHLSGLFFIHITNGRSILFRSTCKFFRYRCSFFLLAHKKVPCPSGQGTNKLS